MQVAGGTEHPGTLVAGQRRIDQDDADPLGELMGGLESADGVVTAPLATDPEVRAETALKLALDPVEHLGIDIDNEQRRPGRPGGPRELHGGHGPRVTPAARSHYGLIHPAQCSRSSRWMSRSARTWRSRCYVAVRLRISIAT
jgi:hypothetical protein